MIQCLQWLQLRFRSKRYTNGQIQGRWNGFWIRWAEIFLTADHSGPTPLVKYLILYKFYFTNSLRSYLLANMALENRLCSDVLLQTRL